MNGMESLLQGLAADGAPDEGLVEAIKSALHGVAHAPRAIERAAGVLLWHRAWQATAPQPKRGRPQGSTKAKAAFGPDENNTLQDVGNFPAGKWSAFDLAAAEALACDPITIYRDRVLAEKLGAEAIGRLWHSPIADNAAALKKVATFGPTEQLSLFSIWESEPDLDFSGALKRLKLGALSEDAELLSRFRQLWERMGSADRRAALQHAGVPDAVTEDVVRSWQKRGRK